MTIAEMHVNFRQYAQKMGMQNFRAILPEQIDMLINQSITDMINQLIREHIGDVNDRVVTDNFKVGKLNAFRTLYDVQTKRITFDDNQEEPTGEIDEHGDPIIITLPQRFTYDDVNRLEGLIKHVGTADNDELFGDYMFFVDMSINYLITGNLISRWYPVRIIDDIYLSDTLNDFVLKNRFRSPVGVIYKNNTLELYIDKFNELEPGYTTPSFTVSGVNNITLVPYQLRISTINKPNVVKYVEDISEGSSVNCNLPEYMHGDIVKHAVDLYRISVSGSLHANQEAEQAQQRENVRNNYRNEGNNQ